MKFIGLVAVAVFLAVFGSEDRAATTTELPEEVIIHELETITGMNDGHELVGRRVELHVPVQGQINDVAIWVGSADNRLLVVLPSGHGLDAESDGKTVAISGTVDRVPKHQLPYSWDRPIYIRADALSTAQAGTAP